MSNFGNEENLGGDAMSSGNGQSKALLALRVIVLVPVLWFFLGGGAIGKIAGKDWMPMEAFFWPLMIAPVALTAAYVGYRQCIRRPRSIPDVRWMYRFAAGMFIFANGALVIFYSWIAVIPAVLSLGILLDSLINRSVMENS
ncbi:hypothetical protein [Streptomyces sp. 8N706]|uniref:hypothetical protein n=1 Tax=Streptomyces sp. 8N706 TaxID=3457416 RepID=UPI003FD6842F